MKREWFTAYCQNAAANVLDKEEKIRFTYAELKATLDGAADHNPPAVPQKVLTLHDNIVKLCNVRVGDEHLETNDEYTLLLTLANIHAAYLMVSGLWKEEPVKPEPQVSECGFEIF